MDYGQPNLDEVFLRAHDVYNIFVRSVWGNEYKTGEQLNNQDNR